MKRFQRSGRGWGGMEMLSRMHSGRARQILTLILYGFLLESLDPGFLLAQSDSVWVEMTGRCYSTDVTAEAGWKRALLDAEANAIRTALGVRVSGETFQINSEAMTGPEPSEYFTAFSELNTSTTCGRVIAEQVLDSTLGTLHNIPVYSVRIRALVAREKGEPDPGFTVEVNLDKEIYYDRGAIDRNDIVNFSIGATRDCYLYVFDIMANDSVMLLLPNALARDNFYSVEGGRDGFSKKIAALPFRIRVGLPPGKKTTTEMIYVVALKTNVEFISGDLSGESRALIPSVRTALLDLQKWLVKIPQENRASSSASFVIKQGR